MHLVCLEGKEGKMSIFLSNLFTYGEIVFLTKFVNDFVYIVFGLRDLEKKRKGEDLEGRIFLCLDNNQIDFLVKHGCYKYLLI